MDLIMQENNLYPLCFQPSQDKGVSYTIMRRKEKKILMFIDQNVSLGQMNVGIFEV